MQEHLFYLTNYTNNEIKQALNSFLSIEDKELNDASFNCFHIGELIMSITDEALLKNTINSLKKKGFYSENEQPILKLNKTINALEFTAVAAFRIKAICYGILLKYECYYSIFHKYTTTFPRLNLDVGNGRVISDLDEIMEDVNGDYIIFIKKSIKELPTETQIKKLKKVIRNMTEINIDYKTDELKSHVERLTSLKENLPNGIKNNDSYKTEKYKGTIWFKVGLLFATGEMEVLLKKFDNKYLKIAKFLNNLSYEKYILASHTNYKVTNTDKNIYYTKDKMEKIIKHCNENNIDITDDFISRLPTE